MTHSEGRPVLEEAEDRSHGERVVLRALARTLLRLADDPAAAYAQVRKVLGWNSRRWLHAFIAEILVRPDIRTGQLSSADLVQVLRQNERLCHEITFATTFDRSAVPASRMRRGMVPNTASIAELNTVGDCLSWLQLEPAELDWFVDSRGWLPRTASLPLGHYHFQWIPKPSGGVRLLEVPKRRLKAIQRTILQDVLRHIPVHPAAHAYCETRSMATALAPHTGQDIVWHLDLTSFFWSIGSGRVRRLFRRLGYPEAVAEVLTGLCTNRVPDRFLIDAPLSDLERRQLHGRHLPQGAPTSPALSNLCAFRLDCRLSALTARYGARYTRYADDLVFSGDARFRRKLPRFRLTVLAILLDEGFQIRRRKTRLLPRGQRQQVGGLVLNDKLNIPKADYDALRAILYNCHRHGPEAENRDAHPSFRDHLLGRIAWVTFVAPERGGKLRQMFDQIPWTDEPRGGEEGRLRQ